MKRLLAGIVILFMVVGLAYAQDRGTSTEAKALLDKAVAFYKASGQAKAFAAFNDAKGQFVSKDLYIFALDMNGKILSHGANASLIGKDMMGAKDADGKLFMKEMVEVGKTKVKGAIDYKWENPKTKKVEQKSSYVEKVDSVILGCGYYK
jgi:signal transduction histidine kinase